MLKKGIKKRWGMLRGNMKRTRREGMHRDGPKKTISSGLPKGMQCFLSWAVIV